MYKFIRCVCLELKNGMLKNRFLLILPVLTGIACYFVFDRRVRYYLTIGIFDKMDISNRDCLLFLYGGMRVYDPSDGTAFLLPIVWIVVFLMGAFGVLHYPVRDLYGIGQQIIVKIGGRRIWWISKCFWNVLVTVYYHGVLVLTVAVCCSISGYSMGDTLNTELFLRLFEIDYFPAYSIPAHMSILCLLTPITVSIAINLLQMLISVCLMPFFAFFCSATLLLSSAYLMTGCLVGNYAMIIRKAGFYEAGLDERKGMLFAGAIMLIVFITGCIRMRYLDILKREE